ncbi:Cytochrome b561 and DOMON domain-containing protein [Rhynchospora pubera]|uniref:Cytochrome b561 and DOMON domain-containing protein n=1 Tax=Rhynchospora pubera TaxID=906938 RepID=A0AAV8FFT9_9POAL|nr:Cytochrome b561 and DOMON domain-containing protein [Rhynchospora pubera]
MKLSVSVLLFLSLFVSFLFTIRADTKSTDSCSSNEAVSSLVPFYSSSFHCLSAWSSQSFILRYARTDTNKWSYVLSAPDTNAYVGIGFSHDGDMEESSAMVGWFDNSSKGVIKQYYLGDMESSACPPDQGNLTLVKNSTLIAMHSSTIYLAFEVITDQPTPYLIYAVGHPGDLPSSNYYLDEHHDRATAKFDANSGIINGAGSSSGFTKARKHSLLVILGWGLLIPIGAMVARYFKSHDHPHWFYGHVSIQMVGFALGLAGIVIGFDLDSSGVDRYDTHKALGIVVLVLGCLQAMALLARPVSTNKLRKYWNVLHHNIGRLAIGFGIANIFLGLSIVDEKKSWYIAYGVCLGAWVVAAAWLETRYRMKSGD